MALQALWPLIAQARPATLVPVCSVGGVTHYVEIPLGDAPAGPQAAKHCPLCVVGSSPAIPAAPASPLLVTIEAPAIPRDPGFAVSLAVREHPARPRAPPLPR